jgi:hypothetical protein
MSSSRVLAGNLAMDIISCLWRAEAVAGAVASGAIVSEEDKAHGLLLLGFKKKIAAECL